jgi:hypothetical protein
MAIQMGGEGRKKKGVRCDLAPPNTPIPTGGRKRRAYEKPWPLRYYSNPCRKAKSNGRMKKLCRFEHSNPGRRVKERGV